MNLRSKLLAAFAGLIAVSMLVAGAALFATLRWQATAADMETHYQRSLLLQRVRAGTFQALKEVDDALTADDVDARADFERALKPTTRDFEQWVSLADTHAEKGEVARVRQAHQRLISNARQVFALIPHDRAAAIRLVDDEVDTGDYERFRVVTEGAVRADQERRRSLRAETVQVRTTTQIMLAVSALSILSLALLIAAYLSHDLFSPLRELARAAQRLSLGDFKVRADAGRDDEIGEIARGLNELAETMEQRSRQTGNTGSAGHRDATPLQAAVQPALARIRARLLELRERSADSDHKALAEDLAQAVEHFADFVLPLDLDLERVDLASLVHDVVSRFRPELAGRAVSIELSLADDLQPVLADRLRLREALGEAVGNALASLPAKGGRLGLRTYAEDGWVRVEVAHSGLPIEGDLIERATGSYDGDNASPGLAIAPHVAERHGGQLVVFSEPGQSTVAQFTLPYRR